MDSEHRGSVETGRCDFLDVLEEAAVRRSRVRVVTWDDRLFVDRVLDVITAEGRDIAVFEKEGRMDVSQIRRANRVDLPVPGVDTIPPAD